MEAHVTYVDTTTLPWQWSPEWTKGDTPGVRYKRVEDAPFARVQVAEYAPGHVQEAHSHPTPEVLYLLGGEITIGDAVVRPGTAVLVDRDTRYGPLVAGPEGATFLRVAVP